ncbi:MAG: hypothetical protein NC181_05595 [Clostridium sp.]|nr:hypothetical protein [Clostridium sp.]MCM1444717.1 hypothetical protein [Candidatus Amulumruptor caecigallinarius]
MGLLNLGNKENKTKKLVSKSIENYIRLSTKELDLELEPLKDRINKCKGIVVFPEALYYYPIDRPQHILRVFAKRGYLCFFCVDSDSTVSFKEIEPNLFIVRDQGRLLPLIKDKRVLFLITYFLQYIFAKMVQDRIIWFDVMGHLEKYQYYNNYSIGIYKEIMNEARIATYRHEEYKNYYEGVRDNIILMKDGIMLDDFVNNNNIIPNDLRKYLFMNKKVLGYFGKIDKNLDFDLIKKLDEKNIYAIILVGAADDPTLIKEHGLRNTYILPEKEYQMLKYYICNFDIVILPFKQNINHELYFKALASSAGLKKIISYYHEELSSLNLPNLSFAKDAIEFVELLEQKLNEKDYNLSNNILSVIHNYSWDNVVNSIL